MRIRRFFLVTVLIPTLFSAGVALAPAARHRPVPVIRVAPADEYFGRLKISILGIRNELHDLDLRLRYAPEKSADVLGDAAYVEDALHDWEQKYPADPWLAKSVYQLDQLYSHVHTDAGQQCTTRVFHWLLGRYGRSAYASQARAEIGGQVK